MIKFRKASVEDVLTYFDWASDEEVRKQSFNSNEIVFEEHEKWFRSKLADNSCLMLIFQNEKNENIGQIRFQEQEANNTVIGISITKSFRGKGLGTEMLMRACDFYLKEKPNSTIHAYIKKSNFISKYSFEKAGFQFLQMVNIKNYESYHYYLKNENRLLSNQ